MTSENGVAGRALGEGERFIAEWTRGTITLQDKGVSSALSGTTRSSKKQCAAAANQGLAPRAGGALA